jgi:cell division protease FtsH
VQQSLIPEKEFSEDTARMIDFEVRKIVEDRMESALETLRTHQDLLHLVAGKLLEKETIESDEFSRLIGSDAKERIVASLERDA